MAIAAGQTRQIQEIGLGEQVLTAQLGATPGAPLQWTARAVVFSDGTSPKPGQIAVLIQFGDEGEIVVTTDQPFLMPDGMLKRADRLTNADQLIDEAGHAVPIRSVWLGKLDIGLHNIAAAGDSEGYLLSVNGVVAGDHMVRALQSSEEYARFFADGHDDLPVIGTAEYAARAGATQFASAPAGAEPQFRNAFVPLAEIARIAVPVGAASFVTAAQATDIRRNGSFRPMSQQVNHAEFQYFQKLFAGFHPDIHFSLNWDDQVPNLYAFNEYGLQIVYVSGALLRSTAIRRDGLAFLMAHGIARLIGAPPGDVMGIACTGQADYFAIGYLFLDVFYGQSSQAGLSALQQIDELLGYVSAEHAGGSNRCMDPSIECRIEALNAALAGQELPYCAGGASVGTLALEKAEYAVSEGATSIVATFSAPVYAGSATNVVNFQIRPVAVVLVAQRNPDRLNQVVLNVVLPEPAAGAYTLTVTDVLSLDGSTLDPARSSTTFTIA